MGKSPHEEVYLGETFEMPNSFPYSGVERHKRNNSKYKITLGRGVGSRA